jgi:tetratricopeptide (TPR) repeat protein
MSAQRCVATLALLASIAAARPPEPWTLARSGHFEIYSDAPASTAPSLLSAFERMYSFFARQVGVTPAPNRPVRIICFGSSQEYDSYRLSPGADAYYAGTEVRDYIVMPVAPGDFQGDLHGDFHLAAHEYSHLLIHASGLHLPRWIAEGISEVASTVRIGARDSSVGGDLSSRSHLLGTAKWMPLSDLFATAETGSGVHALFYSQSWALTAMLMLSPDYGPRFQLLLSSLASGVGSEVALRNVYHTSPDTLTRDLHAWLARIPPPIPLPGIAAIVPPAQPVPISSFASRAMLADLRLAMGNLDQAEAIYRAMAAESRSAEVYAALGVIALRKEDRAGALAAWRQAMDLGIGDAALCYRYAVLADQRGLAVEQIRGALERAIALQPDFDDAHFILALKEQNAGQSQSAVSHLRAIRTVSPARAFAYFAAMAAALLDLGRRADSRAAAVQAREHAATDAERGHADQLIYMADTDLSVQLTSGPDGRTHFQAIRVPYNQPPRNPFIEPGDGIERAEATLSRIECAGNGISVVVSRQEGGLTLSVPDPSRVQIRNTTPGISFEFTCGPQTPRKVIVEYTAARVLRGLELQ